jgi:hypothetical protein
MMDADGIDQVIVGLSTAGLRVGVRAMDVLDESGKRIRDTARRLAPKTGLPHYAAKITHEIRVGPGWIEVEVGAERGGQGSLAPILENGTSRTPPHAHHGPALDLEAPRAVRSLAEILGRL